MDEKNETVATPEPAGQAESGPGKPPPDRCYRVQFRPDEQIYSAVSRIDTLHVGEMVMIQTDHGLEPAKVTGAGFRWPSAEQTAGQEIATYQLTRRANREEIEKLERLIVREAEAFDFCQQQIERLGLAMKLIKVERFFNGSKIIFYFTAENRVDFRELVKILVQEFRTRVEMRQIGVRHETKLIGGLGCCGRELCCASYIKNFAPVSIKMAKEQDVPLNPSKISGICNRLLCCLTYEFPAYKEVKKKMPRVGKTVKIDGKPHKVLQCNVPKETVTVAPLDDLGNSRVLKRSEWEGLRPTEPPKKGKK